MYNVNKGGLTGNWLWGAAAAAQALYGWVAGKRDAKRAVVVEDVVTDVATEAIAKQSELSQALVPLSQKVTPPPELLESADLYANSENASVPENQPRASWGLPLGLAGAAGAAIPLFTGSTSGAETASGSFSAFGYVWSCLSTPIQVGVVVVGVMGALYTAHKIHQAWNQYWANPNLCTPVNQNIHTNTLTNTMHINLQLSPGMKLVKTINEKGHEVIEVHIEEMQKRAAAAAA